MRYFILSVLSVLFIGCSSKHPDPPLVHEIKCSKGIYSLKSAQCLDKDSFISKLEPYDVIFIGDHHNSKKVHEFIADTIYGLSKRGYRIHLANEWFTPKDDPLLDKYASKKIDDDTFVKKIEWNKKGKLSFDIFSPIYHAIIETDGKLYGINLSKKERELISEAKTDEMSKEELSFYKGLDLNVSAHKILYKGFFSHCHKAKKGESDKECIERMYRVQVAWDSKMAKESLILSKNVLKSSKDKLIVFAGAAHIAYGLGINMRFARESDLPFTTIVPLSDDDKSIEHAIADFVYIYEKSEEAKKIEEKLIKALKK